MKTMIWPRAFLTLGIALLPAGLYADSDVYRLGRTAGPEASATSVDRLDIRSGDAAADTIDVRGGGGGHGGGGYHGGGYAYHGGGYAYHGGGYAYHGGGYGYHGGYYGYHGGYYGYRGYGYGYGRGWGYGGYYGWPYYGYGYGYYSPYYYPSVYAYPYYYGGYGYPYYYGAYSAYPYYGVSVATVQPTYYSNAGGYGQAAGSTPVAMAQALQPAQNSAVVQPQTTVSAKPQQSETLQMPTPMITAQPLPMPKSDTPDRPASIKSPIEKVASLPAASQKPYIYAAYSEKPQPSDGKVLVVRK